MINLSEVAAVYDRIRADVSHDLAVVVTVAEPEHQAIIAVCELPGGRVLSWDSGPEIPVDAVLVGDLDWDDYDDMSSKLLLRANTPWFVPGGGIGHNLLPAWSFARLAATIVDSHADGLEDDAVKYLREGRLAAYFPVVEHEAYQLELGRLRAIGARQYD